ncbi:Structural maintenance of chromosomes protein 6 [Lunasporangiospora selenospora]|uniref:Structural maintenance of chromosomes protein 6 n=1 Tax=Lunasporangiospora selenospora TaxID=979761 RepID=A0A9P6G3K0_9FUNG|nr:Structural maintenance of chromosomes protein 6 [Lunasporangiospora selenospora]
MPEATRKRRMIQEEEEEDEEHQQHNNAPTRRRTENPSKGKSAAKRSKLQDNSGDEEEQDTGVFEDDENDIDSLSLHEEPTDWDRGAQSQGNGDEDDEDDTAWKERSEKDYEFSKSKRGRTGTIAEIGVIEVIELFDFMCHRQLKVPFGPKINFIIGHNGSGKSAILTAIIVCLGGKANATNRAQSLKALIREGAQQADVRLRIRNRGPDAFKPDVYGESIIIERRISRDGTSGYRIKSAVGKLVSNKREELSAMCDHMNIQVDNPMNVLSQDTARQFLQSSTPEDKYQFFSRGTQLQQLSQDYELVRECIDITQRTLIAKQEVLPEMYELAKAAQERFKDMQQIASLELKVEGLKQQVAWAQIEELERGVKETEEACSKLLAKIPAIEDKRAQEQSAINELEERAEVLEQDLQKRADSIAPANEERRRLDSDLRSKRSELKAVQEEERAVNDEIKNLKEQIRMFDQKIEQETKKLQSNTQAKRAEAEERIHQLEEENNVSKRHYAELKEKHSQMELQVDERKGNLEQSHTAINRSKNELSEVKERIRQMHGQKQDSLKAFGPSITEVLRDIEETTRNRGWQGEPPVGPLGRHVKLRDQRWAPAIESALGGVLNAFAVQNYRDRATLSKILRAHRCSSDVVITRKVLFDYNEPASRFLTINRVLEFDNEWVRRILIDKNSIEQSILMEKRSEADKVMVSGPRGGFPENVSGCFTINLIRVGDRSGGAASIMMSKYRGPPRLYANVDQELEVQEGNARRLEDSLRYKLRESQEMMRDIEKMEGERLAAKRQMVSIEKDIKMKVRAMESLQDSIQEDEPANLLAYEESKQQSLEQVETMKKQYEPIAVQKQTINESMEPIKQQIAQVTEKLKSHDSETLQVRASTEKAIKYCQRVKVTATLAQLEREIKHIQGRIKEQAAQGAASLEEIAMDLARKQDEYKTAKAAIYQLGQLVSRMKSTLNQRLSRWREFRIQMALRSTISFSLQLSTRGYSGSLEFDHPSKELNITVEPEDQRSAKTGVSRNKDPKSLSGGEKSFSTICLLLALWDSMASSIRCLDEFDVFMDAVNRRISMKMLIDSARESDGVQYILITPQDASSVSPGADVRVHRLSDPERNQPAIQ